MTDQTDIDKRIVEAAKEFVSIYDPDNYMTDRLRRLFNAVQASKPKAARRGVLAQGQTIYLERPAIEATDEVETRCGPTAGVNKLDVYDIMRHGVPIDMADKDTDTTTRASNAIMQLIADAAPAIEEKS